MARTLLSTSPMDLAYSDAASARAPRASARVCAGEAQHAYDDWLAVSLVVPAYDEAESLPALYEKVRDVLGPRMSWELIIVDDGSSDTTSEVLAGLQRNDPRVRAVSLARNCGQTTATRVGIRLARARLLVTLDADLQNDPADIPALLDALGDADAVVGYRVERHDNVLRRFSSRVANTIRNALTGDSVRDTGCALKLFRTEAIRDVPFFEGMHRFLPTLLRMYGYKVIEYPVSHHPRLAGTSKYNVRNRAVRAFTDLLAVRWMRSRVRRPEAHIIAA